LFMKFFIIIFTCQRDVSLLGSAHQLTCRIIYHLADEAADHGSAPL
jgi:hypothetical protein